MLETVYTGLALLPRLSALTLRFPSSRHPRPMVVVPPMPYLRFLKVTDIDPLCYPDDISTLLARSKSLEELKMHWSPRMREVQEPSVMLHEYFRKCVATKSPMKITKLAMQNLYAMQTEDFTETFDLRVLEEVTILSSPGIDEDKLINTFIDKSWVARPANCDVSLKALRHDFLGEEFCEFMASFSGLERMYLVNSNDLLNCPRYLGQSPPSTVPVPSLSDPNGAGVASPISNSSPPSNPGSHIFLRDFYFDSIITNHGATLRHLLLPSRWPLSIDMIVKLARVCPHLEQLALAPETSALETVSHLLPFLHNLIALRILIPFGAPTQVSMSSARQETTHLSGYAVSSDMVSHSNSMIADIVEADDRIHTESMSRALAVKGLYARLRLLGVGRKAWELGKFYTVPVAEDEHSTPTQEFTSINGAVNAANRISTNLVSMTDDIASSPIYSIFSSSVSAPNYEGASIKPVPTRPLKGKKATTRPKSSLGKHHREASSPHTLCSKVNNYETASSGGKVMWRRQIRCVGWEVLKHWEIWALDAQEI